MNLLQNSSENIISEDEIEEIFVEYQNDDLITRDGFIKAVTNIP